MDDEDRELLRDMSDRASTLYWNSDRSVNSIADDLGLSKGRLYDLIRPLGSGQECPNCQSELVFENRTARAGGDPVCPVCDLGGVPLDTMRSAAQRFTELSAQGDSSGPDPTEPVRGGGDDEPASSDAISPEARGVLAGLLVGTVAGILLGRYFRA